MALLVLFLIPGKGAYMSTASRKEKIKKWEEEIAATQKSKEEFDQRCTNKIKDLRQKIEIETRYMKSENNEMIADAVRTIFGEVTEENLSEFKKMIQQASMSSPEINQ